MTVPSQLQAYLLWLNGGNPPGYLGDAFLGGIVPVIPNENGLFIDAMGTGTEDDTAIWDEALATVESLGIRRIYASRISNVKNLNITSPVEIIGSPTFELNLAAGATSNDVVLRVRSGGVYLRNIIIRMEYPDWRQPAVLPAGKWGVLVQDANQVAASTQMEDFYFENVRVYGGYTAGIWFTGGDRITLVNCETSNQYGFGLVLGGSLPITRARVYGHRAISCGVYGFSLSQFSVDPPPYSYGDLDIDVRGMYITNCGKLAFYNGYDGGPKFGIDLTTNSLKRLFFDGVVHNCGIGGIEHKYTQNAPVGVAPSQIKDTHIRLFCLQDCDLGGGGQGINVLAEDIASIAGSINRIYVSADVTYTGPAPWIAAHYYDIGEAVTNGGHVYLCGGDVNKKPGLAGTAGAPTGTNTGLSSYFDGKLYWVYLNDITAVPSVNFQGANVSSSGDSAGGGVTIEGSFTNCAYAVTLLPRETAVPAIKNCVLRNITARNCINGIRDLGNQVSPYTPSLISNLRILNPDLECVGGNGIVLGAGVSGSNGGSSVTGSSIVGGRVLVTGDTFLSCLRFAGGSVELSLSGDTLFEINPDTFGYSFLSIDGSPITISCFDATFNSLGTGTPSMLFIDGSGDWYNYGTVKVIQPDTTLYGYDTTASPVVFHGRVFRGISAALPTTAGNVGETYLIDKETVGTGRWVCTTAGGAGAAVWTAKT